MVTKLKTNFLYTEIENDIITVGFADDEFDTQEYILLQKAMEYDEQDKKLGFDKIHITYSDQSQSTYGGILRFILKNDLISIWLDIDTSQALNTEDRIEIKFSADAGKLAELQQHLQKLFSDEREIFVSEVV